jgi:hypothetical protein
MFPSVFIDFLRISYGQKSLALWTVAWLIQYTFLICFIYLKSNTVKPRFYAGVRLWPMSDRFWKTIRLYLWCRGLCYKLVDKILALNSGMGASHRKRPIVFVFVVAMLQKIFDTLAVVYIRIFSITQLFPPFITLRFVARHSCMQHAQSTLRVLTLFLINTTFTTLCAPRAALDGTRKVLCTWCAWEWRTAKRRVKTGGNSCVTFKVEINKYNRHLKVKSKLAPARSRITFPLKLRFPSVQEQYNPYKFLTP